MSGETSNLMQEPITSVRAVGLKQALSATLSGNARPPKDVADAVGVSYSTLMGWADAHLDSHVPSARLLTLLMVSDDLTLLRYLASLQGCIVVPAPKAGTETVEVTQLAELAGAFAALLAHHAACAGDGRWTRREVDELRPIVTELTARATAQLAYAEQQATVTPHPSARRPA
jgi:hypothetical protein